MLEVVEKIGMVIGTLIGIVAVVSAVGAGYVAVYRLKRVEAAQKRTNDRLDTLVEDFEEERTRDKEATARKLAALEDKIDSTGTALADIRTQQAVANTNLAWMRENLERHLNNVERECRTAVAAAASARAAASLEGKT